MLCRCERAGDIPAQCSGIVRNALYAPSTPLIDEDPDQLFEEISEITELPGLAMCGELFNTLYCTFRYPACSANMQRLRPLCQSQCQMITDQVTQCLNDLPSENFPIVSKMLFNDIICEEPDNYYRFPIRYASDNPDNCLNISKLSLSSVLLYIHAVCIYD